MLLLDEPLSNLDANLREEMRFEIRRLHDEFRITTVYVTHDQAEAMVTSDRIAVMNLGRIEQVDAPHALYNRPKTRFVAGFIGRTNFIEAAVRRRRDRCSIGSRCRATRSRMAAAPSAARCTSRCGRRASRCTAPRPRRPSGALRRRRDRRARLSRRVLGLRRRRRPSSALRLKVSAPPVDIFEVGEKVWLEFDPQQMAPIT